MNKYIKEQGIILLINKYADFRTEEIFFMTNWILMSLFYDKLLFLQFCANDSLIGIGINIYILTNNFFVLVEIRDNEITVLEHKFKKNEKEIYVQFLKDSVNLFSHDFYKHIKIFNQSSGKKRDLSFFKNYKIEMYNIKLLMFSSAKLAALINSKYDGLTETELLKKLVN
jgi:hypothetical protein